MLLLKNFILASRSPRRRLLLAQIGLEPEILPCEIDEELDSSRSPAENATSLALQKAKTVAAGISWGIVLGADTIVALDGHMLGKPIDHDDAVRMLAMLSGRTHTVATGFALIDRPSDRYVTGVEETRVTFRAIPRNEIDEYVAGGSPMDKAG